MEQTIREEKKSTVQIIISIFLIAFGIFLILNPIGNYSFEKSLWTLGGAIFLYFGIGMSFGKMRYIVIGNEIRLKSVLFGLNIKNRKFADFSDFDEIKVSKTTGGEHSRRVFAVGLKGKEFYVDVFRHEDLKEVMAFAKKISELTNKKLIDEV
tara:strand:- start:79 stop:537 length:459 start_codon:yes stop_codon:yes gene_type:complete